MIQTRDFFAHRSIHSFAAWLWFFRPVLPGVQKAHSHAICSYDARDGATAIVLVTIRQSHKGGLIIWVQAIEQNLQ
jgi:hypothetical protein